jgi:hypothetical protein
MWTIFSFFTMKERISFQVLSKRYYTQIIPSMNGELKFDFGPFNNSKIEMLEFWPDGKKVLRFP